MLTCIAILLPTILGFFTIAVILRNDKETFLGERIAFSFPLGAGVLTLQMFFLGTLHVPLTLFNIATLISIEMIGLAVWIWWNKIPLIHKPKSGLFSEFISSQNHWAKKCVFAILLLWIFAKLGSIFLLIGLKPVYSSDALTNWSAGAKVFYNAHSLLLDAPAQDFFGKGAVYRIIFYPLHSPLLQVWISLWNGTFDEVLVKFYNPFYLFSMAICFYYIAMREIKRIPSLTLLAIIMSSPLLSYHSIEANSDLMLSVYLLFASASFLKAMRGNISYWLMTGIFSAEALLTKQEAFFFILPLLLSAMGYFIFYTKRGSRKFVYIVSLLTPFLAVIPWYVFTSYYELGWGAMNECINSVTPLVFGEDPNRISAYLTFHPEVLVGYLWGFVSLQNFNVIIFFFPLLLIASGKLLKESLYLLFPIACYMLFFLILYMFTSYYGWFLWGTVFYRNVLTCYPTICLLTILLLKKHDSFSSVL